MKKNKDNSETPFSEACQKILDTHPVAIGVAYKVLDCGCALLCGMSAGGDPIGNLQHISGQPIKKGARIPICLKCRQDSGLDRVIWEGIYWPGSQQEWPEKDLRVSIGCKVFGPGYMEPE
jgi:hypothetical protein